MPDLEADLSSLLENEALTADLDDDAANILLDWGQARTRLIHRLAADEPDPEGYVSAQMKATRKMMRAVNHWTASRAETDPDGQLAALAEILAYAGEGASAEQQAAFLSEHLANPPSEFIAQLRSFCETR